LDDAEGGQRQLVLTGGDVQVGGHTEIQLNGKYMFHQITSSAISNEPVPYTFFVVQKLVAWMISRLEQGWTFKHHSWHKGANYGLLRARFNKGK
jgi:hypothetical protein